jgi:hypothetical protein
MVFPASSTINAGGKQSNSLTRKGIAMQLHYVGQVGVNLSDYLNGSVVITMYNKPSYEKFGKRIGTLVDVGSDSILVEYKEENHYDGGEYRRYFKKDLQGIFYKK